MRVEDVEKFLAIVKSDIVKIEDLESEVKRLKMVEEANGRLRKYNGELRHALIKEQSHDPVVQIQDDEPDSHLLSNKSVDEVSQTLQDFDPVVFNPIIMEKLFNYLDVKTLKTCRLVFTNWNETASRMLSRQNGRYGLAVRLEKAKLASMTDAFQQLTIQGLHSIVTAAPQNWFSKALLDTSFTRKTEIQSIHLDFGYRLRSIEITGTHFLFQDIQNILVDWCPNLEQLALSPCLNVQDGGNVPGDQDLKEGYRKLIFTRPLKLTSLFMQKQFCISIIKASPNLKTLSCISDMDGFQYFKGLQTCPEVTRNLENITLHCGYDLSTQTQTMEAFNSIQFSSKLKKLEVEAVGQLRAKELFEALDKLGGALERLVLVSNGMDPELVIPGMNNLTEYFTIATPINSIEFLSGMPNLKALYLGEHGFEIRDQDYYIDNLFSDCRELRKNPLKKLKELYVFGVVRSPSPTFGMMNTIFPNLTKLFVGVFVFRHCNDWEELKNYYAAVLVGGISEMRNLRDLYLDFMRANLNDEEGFDYMSFVFNQLNQLSNLNRLTIRDNSNSTTALVGDKLLKIPNLRQVTLIGLKFNRQAAKELTILLHQHDIQLEIQDKEIDDDCRVQFEEQLTFRRREFV